MSQARFQKRQREMQRAEKAKAKAARKADRLEAAAEAPEDEDDTSAGDPEAVMAKLEALHTAFADDQISFEDFEQAKQELLDQLQV